MNWLAHVVLSEPDTDFRLGNLLADLVRGEQRDLAPEQFQRGCACHQVIDSFAETHALPKETRRLFLPPLRRFGGILTDIFYDYCLARDWERWYPEPLEEFADRFHAAAQERLATHPAVPEPARELLQYVIANNRFVNYRSLEGIEDVLQRLSRRLEKRWNRPVPLPAAIAPFREHEDRISQQFAEFYPQLHRHLRTTGWDVVGLK